MAQKFLTDIELTRGLKDSSGDLGSSGQVLSSTGTGLNWVTNAATASVVYQDGFTGDGTTTAFTLANSIDNENKTQVYLDGVYQHKDTYSLSGTTLTFSTAPPNSSDIEVISFASVTADGDILTDSEFSSAGLMKTNGSGTYSIVTDNSSNWNTAYTYSQVGHLPLAGGTVSGNLIVTGDLTINGNTTTLSTQTIEVEDNILQLNTTQGSPDTATATTSGISVYRGNGVTQASFIFDDGDDTWDLTNNLKIAGNLDVDGTEITVGTNGSIFAENNLRFKSSGAAYIDHNTTGQSIVFRTSTSSSLDTTALTLTNAGNATFAGKIGVAGKTPTYGITLAQGTGVNNKIAWTDGTPSFRASMWSNSSDDKFKIATANASSVETVALEIDISQNATFASNVSLISSSTVNLRVTDGTQNIYVGSSGSTRFGLSSGASIIQSTSAAFGIGTQDGQNLTLGTNNTARLTILSAGNIGIGTTSPGEKLEVNGNIQSLDTVMLKNSSSGVKWQFYRDGNETLNFRYNNGSSWSANAISIKNNNNVGIGTYEPTQKLDVVGSGGDTNIRVYDSSSNSEVGLKLQNDAKTWTLQNWGSGGDNLRLLNNAGNIVQLWDDNGNVMIGNANDPSVNLHIASSTPKLRLEDTDGGYAEFAANNTDLVIKTDPDDAVGSSTIQFEIDGSEYMRLQQQGRLGIGTTSPSHILHVVSAGNGEIKAERTSGAAILTQAQSALGRFGTTTDHNLQFITNDTGRLTIKNSGNVGIGTTAPNYKLDVDSTAAGDWITRIKNQSSTGYGLYVQSSNNSGQYLLGLHNGDAYKFIVRGDGNVGINTTSPTNLLDIKGNGNSKGLDIHHSNGNMVAQLIHGGSGDEGQLKLYDSNSETVRISGEHNIASFINSGNVGIGVTSPSEILQINKNSAGNVVGGYFTNSQANTGAEQVSLAFGLNRSGGDFVRQIKAITFGAEQQWTGTPSTVDGFLSFSTVADETVAERMRIGSSGDVLINTHGKFLQGRRSTGSAIIDMIGFGAGTDNLQIKGGTSGGANAISFYDTGGFLATFYNSSFGIGIGTPQTTLQVNGSASALNAHFGQGTNNSSGVFGGISLGYSEGGNASYRKVGIVAKAVGDGAARQDLHFLVDTVSDSGSAGIADSKMSIAATTGYVTINERLGVGTTSPSGDVDIAGPYLFLGTENANNGTTYLTLRNYDSTLVDQNDVPNMIRMTSRYWSGAASQLVETRITHIKDSSNGNGGSALGFMTQTGGDGPVEHMRINKLGDVIIGGTGVQLARTASFDVGTNNIVFDNCTTSGAGNGAEFQTFRRNNGTNSVQIGAIVMNGTSGVTYATSSDYRLKENVVELTNALDRVDQLKPSRFNFISDENRTIDGFLAHEVQDIVPEAIVGTKDEVDEDGNPKYQSIDQSKLVPLLVGAIKELKAEIEQLKTQINGTN